MHARLTTHDNEELDRAAVLAVRDGIKGTIDAQLSTSLGTGVRDRLLEMLGDEGYQRVILDLANNIVQTLL